MAITHFTKLQQPKKSAAYDLYWQFAAMRFEIFLNRLTDLAGPWTKDPILQKHRFTNVFRASDRVSQYLIRLQYQQDNKQDILFRTLLFKVFNKIETYQYLEKELGELSYRSFSFKRYDDLLTNRMARKKVIYSAAYIMPSASGFGHRLKHSNHLALISDMMKNGLDRQIQESKSLEEIYKLLLSYPSLGGFLAFQYAIDINYSSLSNFSEMDFVVAGPGARNGILKCFDSLGDFSLEDVIRMMANDQETECKRLGLHTPALWGRRLQLIDCQNIFCEVDKYLRVAKPDLIAVADGRKRIKQKYSTSQGPIEFFFPPKWKINEKITPKWMEKAAAGTFL